MTQYEKMQAVIDSYKKRFGPEAYSHFINYGIDKDNLKNISPTLNIKESEETNIRKVLDVMSKQLQKLGTTQRLEEKKYAESSSWIHFGYKSDYYKKLDIKCRVYIPIKPEASHDGFFAECLKMLINSNINFSGKIAKKYRNDSLTFEFEDKELAKKFVDMVSSRQDLMSSLGEKNPFLEDANGMGFVDFSNFDPTKNSYTEIVSNELENYMLDLNMNQKNLNAYKTATIDGFREYLSQKAKTSTGDNAKLLTQIVNQIDNSKQKHNESLTQAINSKTSQTSINSKTEAISAKDSLEDLKGLYEKYKVVINGQIVELIDRNTNKPVNMNKGNKIDVIKKVTLAEKWIESAGYGLSKSGGKNEFGIDPRQYEYAFNDQAKETFAIMMDKMQEYKNQGKSFEVQKFAQEVQDITHYKYSENIVYGLLSYPNPNTPDGYQKIMNGVPQKTDWQYRVVKNQILDIAESNYEYKTSQKFNQSTSINIQAPKTTTVKKNQHYNSQSNDDIKTSNQDLVNENNNVNTSENVSTKSNEELSNSMKNTNLEINTHDSSKEVDNKENVQTTLDKDEISTENSDQITIEETKKDKNKSDKSFDSYGIYPEKLYTTYKGLYNGRFDGFLAFLDDQVIRNQKLLNNNTIKQPIVNLDVIDSLLLNKCKTQSDYHDLEHCMESLNELGGIATGYYNVCKQFLSKLSIKATSDEDLQEMKESRQNSIDNINFDLSKNPLYSRLNIERIVQEIKSFEDTPSVEAKDRVSLTIEYLISKCENQEDFEFLNDCLEHISSHTLYSSTFILDNKYSGVYRELNSEFNDSLIELNNRSIKVSEKLFEQRHGVKFDPLSTEKGTNTEETQDFDNTKVTEQTNAEKTQDKILNKCSILRARILVCKRILEKGKFFKDFPMFQSYKDIEKFINETALSDMSDIKQEVSKEEYEKVLDEYNEVKKTYSIVKENNEKNSNNEQISDSQNLVSEVQDFISDVVSKLNQNGMTEFNGDMVRRKSREYLSKLNQNRQYIDDETFNKAVNKMNEFLDCCSMLDGM